MSRRDGRLDSQAAVIGGGIVGLAAALALARAGASVTLIDRGGSPGTEPPSDGRSAALLAPAIDFLGRLGVWPALADGAAPLRRLRIVHPGREGDGGAQEVVFEAGEIGASAFGFNVANHDLRRALAEAVAGEPGIRLRHGEEVRELHASGAMATLGLGGGHGLRCALVVGADGRDSSVRRAAGIGARHRDYGQMALACSFAHARDHGDTSTELHRPGGPLTTVPLPDRRSSSLVWVERTAEARRLLALGDGDLAAELEGIVAPWLGPVRRVAPRHGYPLTGVLAHRLAAPRVALVGEAAHVLSPIGAQGLNLSLCDVDALASLVAPALARRADPGDPELLAAYERQRMPDVRARFLAVDGLNRAVASEVELVHAARGMGLRLIGAVAPLRRGLMRATMRPFAWPALPPVPPVRG